MRRPGEVRHCWAPSRRLGRRRARPSTASCSGWGAACQIDTWDPKRRGDAKANKPGSYYAAIDTAISGTQVCEHLPRSAKLLDRCNILHTVHHEVIDEHAAAVNRMHTGRPTADSIIYPSLGSVVAEQHGGVNSAAPAYVLIGYPNVTRGRGFLGAKHGYIYLTDTKSGPSGLARPANIRKDRQDRRERLLTQLRADYLQAPPAAAPSKNTMRRSPSTAALGARVHERISA